MAPKFVNPYVKSNKNDAADIEAICEAVDRPSMRFVPIKNIEQQSVLSLRRHAAAEAQFLRQVFPWDARLQDIQDAAQCCAVVNRAPTAAFG